MNEDSDQIGAIQLLGITTGLMLAPVMTPALIWATIAANLPVTLVIVQLAVMAVISTWLSRKTASRQTARVARHGDRKARFGYRRLVGCRGRGRLGRDHGVGV